VACVIDIFGHDHDHGPHPSTIKVIMNFFVDIESEEDEEIF
jgi:hypothetical protein